MKPARIVALVIALVGGGIAALLGGRSAQTAAPVPAPLAQLETIDILVADNDIGPDQTLPARRRQTWPATAGSARLHPQERPVRRGQSARDSGYASASPP